MKPNRIKYAFFFVFFSCCFVLSSSSQLPSVPSLFEKLKQKIEGIETIRYQLEYTQLYGGRADSIYTATSTVWAEKVATDTIFGAHLHILQKSNQGTSEYFYDGKTAIDIYHTHVAKELQESITVMQPFKMRGGNAIQTLMTVAFGYYKEILSSKLDTTWIKHLNVMRVEEEGKYWVIGWNETDTGEDFRSTNRLYIDKESGLLYRIFKRSIYRGLPFGKDVIISHIRINHPTDPDSIRLTRSFPAYKVLYVDRHNYGGVGGEPVSLLKGTRIRDFKYENLVGGTVPLKTQKGKLVLLDFWETWCGACFVAMPKLVKLYEDYKDKGLEIVAVVTENKEQVKKVVASQKIPYPTVWGDQQIIDYFKLSARPRYLLVDNTGTVVADSEGDLNQMQEEIKRRLK